MANILHVVNSFDPAGDVTRCVRELNKYSKHKHEVVIKDRHPFQDQFQFEEAHMCADRIMPHQIIFYQGWADAVIYHFLGVEDGYVFPGKPWGFRNATAYYNKVRDKFFATYDTTAKDLSKFHLIGTNHLGAADFLGVAGNDVHFLPSLIPLEDPLYLPSWTDRKPCVSMIKSPEKHYNAKYAGNPSRQYLYGKSHRDIMDARRYFASIVIDNTTEGHYGLAGLEAMALGLPVVVHNHAETQLQLSLISVVIAPGFIEVEFDQDVSGAVNYHMNLSIMERQKIRHWMDAYYHSRRLINKFWDPFCDELLEAECQL